jgi:hypothetical protein
MMDVILSTEKTDLLECDVLATVFFEDERPLKGSSGWIDWRLNGRISHFLIEKRLTGDWKEMTLIPSNGRVTSHMLLLVGLGKVRDYSYLRLREISPHLLETLKNLNISSICVSLPYEKGYNMDCGKSAEVLVEGVADYLDASESKLSEDFVEGLMFYFSVEEEKFAEALLGVQTAQSILKDRLKIRIFTPSERKEGVRTSK